MDNRMDQAETFLASVGDLLAASLDYEATLASIAGFAVRSLADFCVVDVVADGEIRRLQIAHANPELTGLTRELLRFPLDRTRPHLSLEALETGKAVLIPDVTGAVLDALSQGPEHRRILDQLRPRSLMAVPLVARDRLFGVLLFVSSGRRYNEADMALAARLVQLAALELDNARLYGEARQALLARDRVLGIVAHDLRNPLNTIVMSAAVLRDASLPAALRDGQAQIILRSARRMNRLIQDLLDVASIEAGRLSLRQEIEDPAAVVAEAVEMNSALARARSVSLGHDPMDHVPPISADWDRVLQVLSNLIDNAIKFTPPGGNVNVSVERVDDGVRFTVADTGQGISPEDLSRLFQPFWQAQHGTHDGAGLGLMIARGIVEAHGGTLESGSTPGQGSTFSFTIPTPGPSPAHERRGGRPDRRTASQAPDPGPDPEPARRSP